MFTRKFLYGIKQRESGEICSLAQEELESVEFSDEQIEGRNKSTNSDTNNEYSIIDVQLMALCSPLYFKPACD